MPSNPVYNVIGKTYDTTRKADPEMVEKIIHLLQPHENGKYLDIACGSGNYTNALNQREIEIEGIAGFKNIQQSPFFVTNELQYLFLHAGKYRPEIYLDETVRNGMSFFHISSHPQEMSQGLENLKSDLATGKIREIIQRFESTEGDCMFVTGEK